MASGIDAIISSKAAKKFDRFSASPVTVHRAAAQPLSSYFGLPPPSPPRFPLGAEPSLASRRVYARSRIIFLTGHVIDVLTAIVDVSLDVTAHSAHGDGGR